jgi:hypothetical protein
MRSFFGWIWDVYTELLKLAGNLTLVVIGIAGCAFATIRQYDPAHSTQENTIIFIVSIALVISSWVRRFIWSSIGLGVPWVMLVAGVLYLTVSDHARFDFSLPVLLVAFVPPVFGAFLLEVMPKPPAPPERKTFLPSEQ